MVCHWPLRLLSDYSDFVWSRARKPWIKGREKKIGSRVVFHLALGIGFLQNFCQRSAVLCTAWQVGLGPLTTLGLLHESERDAHGCHADGLGGGGLLTTLCHVLGCRDSGPSNVPHSDGFLILNNTV